MTKPKLIGFDDPPHRWFAWGHGPRGPYPVTYPERPQPSASGPIEGLVEVPENLRHATLAEIAVWAREKVPHDASERR